MEIVICFSRITFVIIHVRRNINMHDSRNKLHLIFSISIPLKEKKKKKKRDSRLINENLLKISLQSNKNNTYFKQKYIFIDHFKINFNLIQFFCDYRQRLITRIQ